MRSNSFLQSFAQAGPREALPTVFEHPDGNRPEICYLTAGEKEKALSSIETQLDHNHLFEWTEVHRQPMYDLIRDEPRYLAALKERDRRIAAQREAVEIKENRAKEKHSNHY